MQARSCRDTWACKVLEAFREVRCGFPRGLVPIRVPLPLAFRPISYEFVINGFLCALIVGPLLGAMGTMVIIKRMAQLVDGLC